MLRTLAIALSLLASGCASIGAFNATTPHDEGAVRIVNNAPYGEGERRTLDVYGSARGARNAPVVVFFYGGAWSGGAKEEYSFAGDAFAAQGFVTVVPDYRVFPEVRFPAFVEDGAASLQWVQENIDRFGGDPDRIVLVGHSAGAHIAMLAALDPHYAEVAGFDRRAIRGVVGLAGAYGFANFDAPLLNRVFGQAPDPWSTMPIHYVSRSGPPILLLHGADDARIPLRSVNAMFDRALAAGQSVEMRVYPHADHAALVQALSLARRNEFPALRDTIEFARRVTGQTSAHRPTETNAVTGR